MMFEGLSQQEKRDLILALLHDGEIVVEFTKVNGEVRKMPCTLAESLLPPPPVHYTNTDSPIDFPKPKKERKQNLDVISVFCTDKQEWRSFRVDSVISIS